MCVASTFCPVSCKGKKVKGRFTYSAAFAHAAFSGAVLTDRAAVPPRRQQAKPTHTDFDPCCHTAERIPSLLFK